MKLPASFQHALAFIDKLPDDLPFPELCKGDEGTVLEYDWMTDWYASRGRMIGLQFGSHGDISYGWSNDGQRGHGVIRPGQDPAPLIAKIREVVK